MPEIELTADKTDDSKRKSSRQVLSDMQNLFVAAYTDGPTAKLPIPSAKAAGYSPASAKAIARRMTNMPHIRAAIDRAILLKGRQSDDPAVEQFEARLEKAANFNVTDVFEQDFTTNEKTGELLFPHGLKMRPFEKYDSICIKSIQITETAKQTTLKVEAIDPLRAGELMLRQKDELKGDGEGKKTTIIFNMGFGEPEPQVKNVTPVEPEKPRFANPEVPR